MTKVTGAVAFYFWGTYFKIFCTVIFYLADENQWQLSFFDAFEKETVLKKGQGTPPAKLDAYKSLIDECGIKNEKLEDSFFSNSIDILGIKVPNLEDLNFLRISELYKKDKYELFTEVLLHIIGSHRL